MLLQAWYLLLCYLLGSLPIGLVLSTIWADVDLREAGSGNIGATNVLRTSGRTLGLVTLLLDALKGALPVAGATLMFETPGMWGVAGVLAVLGHCASIFLDFKGGKGVATSAGALGVLLPLPTLGAAAVWGLVLLVGRRSSLASLSALLAMQGFTWWLAPGWLLLTLLVALIIVWRHRENLRRLRSGTEAPIR